MAAPALAPADVAGFVALLQGLGMVARADLAPLATRAQVALLPTLAQIQALLAPLGVPTIAAAASATVQAISAARAQNAHDSSEEPYAVVPRADGTPPPAWPPALDRTRLRSGPIAAVNALLNDYGLAVAPGANALVRRNAVARHIGTMRL
jgi:hypothetical protein